MNGIILICINAVTGAVIGALTNDMAIRYIFRKIIPARRGEIGEAIKNVVATELMSPDKIILKLKTDKVKNAVEENLLHIIDDFCNREIPSLTELIGGNKNISENMVKHIAKVLFAEFRKFIEKEDFYDKTLVPIVEAEVKKIFLSSPEKLIPGIAGYIEKLPDKISMWLLKSDTCNLISEYAGTLVYPSLQSDKKLKDIISDKIIDDIKAVVYSSLPDLSNKFAIFLERDDIQQKMKTAMKEELEKAIERKTPAFIKKTGDFFKDTIGINVKGMLMNAVGIDKEIDKLCRDIPHKIRSGADTDTSESIKNAIDEFINDILDTEVNELTKKINLNEEKLILFFKTLYKHLIDNEKSLHLGRHIKRIANGLISESIRDIMNKIEYKNNSEEKIIQMLSHRIYDLVTSEKFMTIAQEKTEETLIGLTNKKIGKLSDKIKPEYRRILASLGAETVITGISVRFEDFAHASGMWDIITSSLNSYSDREIEILVRKVANKELKWVTILGGIIGFIIGTLQGILNIFL